MWKYLLIGLLLCTIVSINAQESETVVSSETAEMDSSPQSMEDFLARYIGQDIVIYVANLDVTMNGRLLHVLEDGVIIQPIFRQKIFIQREFIAFVEVKGSDKKKPGK
jgi:hypothetical protein